MQTKLVKLLKSLILSTSLIFTFQNSSFGMYDDDQSASPALPAQKPTRKVKRDVDNPDTIVSLAGNATKEQTVEKAPENKPVEQIAKAISQSTDVPVQATPTRKIKRDVDNPDTIVPLAGNTDQEKK